MDYSKNMMFTIYQKETIAPKCGSGYEYKNGQMSSSSFSEIVKFSTEECAEACDELIHCHSYSYNPSDTDGNNANCRLFTAGEAGITPSTSTEHDWNACYEPDGFK